VIRDSRTAGTDQRPGADTLQSAGSPQQSYRELSATNIANGLTSVFIALPSQLDSTNAERNGLKIRPVSVRAGWRWLPVAVLGTDLGTEQAELDGNNRDAAEEVGRRKRG
jgi:hypothetical protein